MLMPGLSDVASAGVNFYRGAPLTTRGSSAEQSTLKAPRAAYVVLELGPPVEI